MGDEGLSDFFHIPKTRLILVGIFALLTITYFTTIFGLNLFSYVAFTAISLGIMGAYFKLSSILKELQEPRRRELRAEARV